MPVRYLNIKYCCFILATAFPILFFISFSAKAQLTTSTSLTPSQLVQTILLGGGVTATNITYNGAPLAIGEFNGSSSNIGLPSGVILSSGLISNAVGPNNTGSKSYPNNLPGNSDLDQIMSPTLSYDAAILEFDFIPVTDTVKFRYVFGSEEYMEYVSSSPGGINDGFGFFISGPGINGSFANNAKNIAIIPGTILPVTMFNLNLNKNGNFYFDNGNGWGSGTAPDGLTVQYDGFTVPLTAVSAVQCGETYHIKIAIGDGGDGILDSGVFLEAGSFSSEAAVPPPDISVNLGCVRQISTSNYSGTNITWNSIYPGALGEYNNYLSCTTCLNPMIAQLTGAPPYIDFQLCGVSASCNPAILCDTVRVSFYPPLVVTVAPQNPILCVGQTSTTITATGSGGNPPYSYLWNNANSSQSIVVGNGVYTVEVTDASGCDPVTSSVTVTSYSVAISADAGPDQTVCKQNPITTVNGSVIGASGGIWSGGTGTFSPNNSTLSGATYSPSSAELAAGFVYLRLTTTGNGNCAAASDTVKINYINFIGTVSIVPNSPSCPGGTNGTATASIIGSTSICIYFWNTAPAQSGATATNLSPGIYSVTITNNIGCTTTNSVTIPPASPISLASSITNVSCSGGNNGSISITTIGGTPPYTYLWSTGSTTSSIGSIVSQISNLTAQNYSVTVTDSKLCPITTTFTITQPAPISIVLTPTPVNCLNGSDGIANSAVSGGTSTMTSPYIYNWSSGATSPNASGLSVGTYTLTVEDNLGCLASASVTIAQPNIAFTASTSSTNETCSNLNNGTATASYSGGTPGYTYLWSNGATTSQILNLNAQIYTVTIKDFKGCTATASATITQPAPLTINFISQINVSCFGGADGAITANPSGGTFPYTYLWSPGGATTATVTNLPIATYTVTVTDFKGCIKTSSVVITQPALLTASTTFTNEMCSSLNNGTAAAVYSGGTAGYSFLWQPGLQTTSIVSNLSAGSYTLTVTDSKGCTAIANTLITEPLPLIINFTGQSNVSCNSGSNGVVTATPSGGTLNYSYLWSNTATTSQISNLTSQIYTVTVTDNLGCVATSTVMITQPEILSASTSKTNKSCNNLNNGTATAIISGGTPVYNYLWSNGATTNQISNLSSQTYTLTVTDFNGCTAITSALINEPAPLAINFNGQKNVSCFAGNDGFVTVTTSGGTPNYLYLWSNGATTANISNLTSQTYTLIVNDNFGCADTNAVFITQPAIVTATTSITNETCNYKNDGTATAIPSGGNSIYTYSWQPDLQTTQSIGNLSAGTYTLTVSDSNGCKGIGNAIIAEPAPIAISITAQTNVKCFAGNDGSITASVSGGTPNYLYLWSNGATTSQISNLTSQIYSVTVTDNFGCTATKSVTITQPTQLIAGTSVSNETCNSMSVGIATAIQSGGTPGYSYLWLLGGQTTNSITNLSAATYTLIVTDFNGCKDTTTAIISEPAPLTINLTIQANVSCFGGNNGSILAIPSGGTPNYTYLWSSAGATTASISNLVAGLYSVTVTDNSGCVATNSVTITQPLAALSVSTSSLPATCYGGTDGSVACSASGGTLQYMYIWLPGNITGQSISSLSAGNYTVTAIDSLGCTAVNSVALTQPPQIILTTTSVNSTCSQANGQTSVSIVGGNLPYTYLWSSGGTDATASGLLSGAYSVVVTDNTGCTSTQFANVSDNSAPSATIVSVINVGCYGDSTGSAQVNTTGGAGPFTYSWLPSGGTNSVATGLKAGLHTVIVTGSNTCQTQATINITQPDSILLTVTNSMVSCFGGNDGTATAIASGGNSGYSYLWLPGTETSASITNLSAITYTLEVTDANSCVQTLPFSITEPLAMLSDSFSVVPVNCFGGADGSVSVFAFGGTAPYGYNWMPGNYNGQTISNLTAGTYTVTIIDSKLCTLIDSVTVTVISSTPIILTTDSINSNCNLPDGQASVIATGGLGSYLYQWSPSGGTNAATSGVVAGVYNVTVQDSIGCTSSKGVTVKDIGSPDVTIFSTSNVSCYADSNGTAIVSVSGGVGPFTYSWLPTGGGDSIATGLAAGSYSVTVTGSNGCQSAPVIVTITQPPPILITLTKNNVSCFGGNDGTATVLASGGTPGYTYLWKPGGNTGLSITNLYPANDTIQVTDANNCVQTLPFIITQPLTALSVASLSSTAVTCFNGANGTASCTATGGTAFYNYNWMPGNINGQTYSNLTTGTYTVTVIDSKLCTIIDSVTVTVISPTPVILTTDSINSNCNLPDGQASVIASGGIGTYQYQWTPTGGTNAIAPALVAGLYNVLVNDSVGCISTASVTVNNIGSPVATVSSTTNVTCNTGSDGTATVSVTDGIAPFTYSWLPTGGSDSIATGLAPGTYSVTVTGGNGCPSLPIISPEITQPYPILITVTKSMVTCFGANDGTITTLASGGTAGYSYQWLPGGPAAASITNLSPNTYTIQVTDNNNCVQTNDVLITEPSQLSSVISSSTNVKCNGSVDGTATSVVSGGSPVYYYNWLPSGGNGAIGTSMAAGSYTLTVTDFNGCNSTSSVTITQPGQALSATNVESSITCSGGLNGTVGIYPSGGTPAYSYQWNPSVSVTDTASGLAAGNYSIIVTDSNNCQVNVLLSLSEPSAINGSLVTVNSSCGLSNGSVSSQLSGGTLPYSYLWSWGGATTSGISGLDSGTYNLQVTDAFNCPYVLSANLIVMPDFSISFSSINNVSCNGGNDGSATVNINQGTAPFIINWLPAGGNSLTASLLTVNTYTINVTDASGCQRTDSVIITEPAPIDVAIDTVVNVLCYGGSSGSISISPTGGTGTDYTYSWSMNSSTSSTATALTVGTYTVNVMDENSCIKAISISVAEPALLSSTIDSVLNPACFNGFGSASVLVSGGVFPYSYSWSAPAVGQTGSTANNIIAGSYTVTVTDTNSCITTSNVLISEPSQVLTTAGANDTLCLGQSGSVSATAIGGSGNYSYVWQPSGAITAGTLPITPTSSITYTVVAYDQNGCAGTPASLTSIVYNLTNDDINVYGTTPICPGQSSYVYVETAGSLGPLSYQWNNNLGNGPGGFTVTPTQPTTYMVTVSNMCGLSVTDSAAVLFNPPPTIVFTADTNVICVPGSLAFFDSSLTGNGSDPITMWIWNFGDGSTSTQENPTHSYALQGTYLVTLTVSTSGGCTNNTSTNPLTITAYPIPTAVFSVNSTNLDLPFEELVLNNQSAGAVAYDWSFGDGGTSTLNNPQYLYTDVGVFQVQLIAMSDHGCLDTAYVEVTTNADLIFPNVFTPNTSGSQGGAYNVNNLDNDIFFPYSAGVIEYKLEIYNRWGEMIFESKDIKQGWDGYYEGKLCPQDVYIWNAYARLTDGKIVHKKGNLTLLR